MIQKKCIAEGCENKCVAKLLCNKHYQYLNRTGSIHKKPNPLRLVHKNLTNAYKHMMSRCFNKNVLNYNNYGGRGITVCDRWKDKENGLKNFINDMGEKPTPKHSLDRKNNNCGYSPDNCRWATSEEQNRNKRNTKMVIYNGKEVCLRDFCDENGHDFSLIYGRVLKGKTLEKALTDKKYIQHHSIEINGIKGTLTHWAKVYDFNKSNACAILKKGGNIEAIIEASKKKREEISNGRASVFLEFEGQIKSICEWSKELNIPSQTIFNRYKKGYSTKDCLKIVENKNYYLDNIEFKARIDLIEYIVNKYKVNKTTITNRLFKGATEYQCTLTKDEYKLTRKKQN